MCLLRLLRSLSDSEPTTTLLPRYRTVNLIFRRPQLSYLPFLISCRKPSSCFRAGYIFRLSAHLISSIGKDHLFLFLHLPVSKTLLTAFNPNSNPFHSTHLSSERSEFPAWPSLHPLFATL